jgi:2-dehydropantoate 2-reductase
MRILVVGAGAIGGYFGGRLLEAGRDVTFLVRPRRAAQLASTGLVIRSPHGNFESAAPATIAAEDLHDSFDLILLSCKAYDLNGAIDSCAAAVGAATAILPVLNGMAHIEVLEARFGAARVLGGLCVISTALDPQGRILHLNDADVLTFGARDGVRSVALEAIDNALSGARFQARYSDRILQEMWEKWVFIASLAGITCLMRAAIGDIIAAGAADLALQLLKECAAIASQQGFAPSATSLQAAQKALTAAGSTITASMLRDIERGAPIEAQQIVGDLLRRGEKTLEPRSLLRIADVHLRAYEARRARAADKPPAT